MAALGVRDPLTLAETSILSQVDDDYEGKNPTQILQNRDGNARLRRNVEMTLPLSPPPRSHGHGRCMQPHHPSPLCELKQRRGSKATINA